MNKIFKTLTCLFILLNAVNFVFGQTDSIEKLTAAIEKNPAKAELFLRRGDLYADLWNDDQKNENIVQIARAAADYSAYLKLKPADAQVYAKRAEARNALFINANSFTLADLRKAVALNPRDAETSERIPVYEAEYKKLYRSKECVDGRVTNGFQGHPADTPLTRLAEYLDPAMLETGGGTNADALKAIACGANVNYVYKSSGASELSGFNNYLLEHLIALLEAGARTASRDRNGNTILMQTLDLVAKSQAKTDRDFFEKLKIVLQYGANLNARNKRGQTVLTFAQRTKSPELIKFLKEKGAK